MPCTHPPRQWHEGVRLLPCADPDCQDGFRRGVTLVIPDTDKRSGAIVKFTYSRNYILNAAGQIWYWRLEQRREYDTPVVIDK